MIDTDKCQDCKNKYDENDVWHGVIDLQLWKTTSICEGCFEEDGGYRYKSNADIEALITEFKRLRGELERIENNMAWTVHVWQNENYTGRQEWMEQMCEMYTDLAFVKAIEAEYYGDEEE